MIFVFKTSVKTLIQAKQLSPCIGRLLPDASWNFDLTDCDHILRIDSDKDIVAAIKGLLQTHHFDCEELQ